MSFWKTLFGAKESQIFSLGEALGTPADRGPRTPRITQPAQNHAPPGVTPSAEAQLGPPLPADWNEICDEAALLMAAAFTGTVKDGLSARDFLTDDSFARLDDFGNSPTPWARFGVFSQWEIVSSSGYEIGLEGMGKPLAVAANHLASVSRAAPSQSERDRYLITFACAIARRLREKRSVRSLKALFMEMFEFASYMGSLPANLDLPTDFMVTMFARHEKQTLEPRHVTERPSPLSTAVFVYCCKNWK